MGLTQEALLRQLNPRLRGWANYYRNGASKQTFGKLDYYVYNRIRRWIQRRHPNKSIGWQLRKYYSAADKGTFSVRCRRKTAKSRVLSLYRVASTQIERHIKVRGDANPYDPKYTKYFEMRRRWLWRMLWSNPDPEWSPEVSGPLEVLHSSLVAAACPQQAHRLERLEPYEGKLSRTVLRGVRAG